MAENMMNSAHKDNQSEGWQNNYDRVFRKKETGQEKDYGTSPKRTRSSNKKTT